MFKGTYTALISPFKNDLSIDEEALEILIEEQVAAGIEGLVVCGTTGEAPTLLEDEHLYLIKRVAEIANGRIKVIAGTGANSTAEAVERTRNAAKYGIDGTLQVSPYYNKPSQEGIYQHFKAISEAEKDLPMILYNVPGRTACNMELDTICRLAELDNVVCLKDASGSVCQFMEVYRKVQKDNFTILSGDDALSLAFGVHGSAGVISVASNLFPKEIKELTDAILSDDYLRAKELHYKYLDFFVACFFDCNPSAIKTLMKLKGKSNGKLRLPLIEVDGQYLEQMKEILVNLD
ncbi:MAG: 4-hydroxy-tetrahydrodipicolinate synthase [Candidatus Gracilibacteria bacterium]|jgi:4-hydroxy-tetrahydrodipicolinate synthase|nr:4-hydroxy-tetrahydrodipicolinate synthase [Candidatus Gracilibacteria bacterium]